MRQDSLSDALIKSPYYCSIRPFSLEDVCDAIPSLSGFPDVIFDAASSMLCRVCVQLNYSKFFYFKINPRSDLVAGLACLKVMGASFVRRNLFLKCAGHFGIIFSR